MSRYMNPRYAALEAYVPGEQPKGEFIKLNANESPYPPSPGVLEAVRGAEGTALNMYPDAACRALDAALAESLGVGPENILCANGSDDILNFCFMAYGQSGALFPEITYGFYEVFCALHGIEARRAPMHEGLALDPADYFDAGRLVVIANPNAQTGVEMPLAGVEAIVRNNPGNVVVVDEAYVAFGGESALPLTKKYPNVLVVRTFSKSRSMAGARLGFAVGGAELIADLSKLKYSTNPYSVNRTALAAGSRGGARQRLLRGELREDRRDARELCRGAEGARLVSDRFQGQLRPRQAAGGRGEGIAAKRSRGAASSCATSAARSANTCA